MKRNISIFILSFTIILFFLYVPPFFLALAQTSNGACAVIEVPGSNITSSPLQGCAGGGNQDVVAKARTQLGDPYVWGAPNRNWASTSDNPNGFDCSGLVGWSWYKATGGKVNFPGSTKATWGNVDPNKFQTFTPAQKDQIQPGDAIYWSTGGNIHHTALYVGSGNCGAPTCIIEAQTFGVPVKESSFEARINSSGDPWVGFIRPINY